MNIEHGVQVTGTDDMTVMERSIATVPMRVQRVVEGVITTVALNPKVGDTLTHPDGTYRLDVETANNGVNKRFILLPLEA